MKKISNFKILTIPYNKKFVVSSDKTTDFKNIKINQKLRIQNEKLCKKLTKHINN